VPPRARGRVRALGEFTFHWARGELKRGEEVERLTRPPPAERDMMRVLAAEARRDSAAHWRSTATAAAPNGALESTCRSTACGPQDRARSGRTRCLCKPYAASAIGGGRAMTLARRRLATLRSAAEQVSAGGDAIARLAQEHEPLASRSRDFAHHHRPMVINCKRSSPSCTWSAMEHGDPAGYRRRGW